MFENQTVTKMSMFETPYYCFYCYLVDQKCIASFAALLSPLLQIGESNDCQIIYIRNVTIVCYIVDMLLLSLLPERLHLKKHSEMRA